MPVGSHLLHQRRPLHCVAVGVAGVVAVLGRSHAADLMAVEDELDDLAATRPAVLNLVLGGGEVGGVVVAGRCGDADGGVGLSDVAGDLEAHGESSLQAALHRN